MGGQIATLEAETWRRPLGYLVTSSLISLNTHIHPLVFIGRRGMIMPLAPRRAPTSPHPTIYYPLSTHERPDVPSEMHITNEMKALFNLHSNPLCREQQQPLDLPHHLQPLPLLPVPLPRAVEGPRHRLSAIPAVHAALLRAGRPGGARGPGAPQVLHAAPEGQVREKHSHQKGA